MDIKEILGQEIYETLTDEQKKTFEGKEYFLSSDGNYIPKAKFDYVLMLQHNHLENNYSFKTQELNSYNSSGIYNPKGKKNFKESSNYFQ